MGQPSLDEYFTLTNDFLFKMIFGGYTGEQDPQTGSVSKVNVSLAVIESKKSITLTAVADETQLFAIQMVSAYHSVEARIKALVL